MLITTPTEKSEEEKAPPELNTEDLAEKIRLLSQLQHAEQLDLSKTRGIGKIESAEYTSKTHTEASIPKILFSKTSMPQPKFSKGVRKVNKVSGKV